VILKNIIKENLNEMKNNFYDVLFDIMGCSLWRMVLFIIEQLDYDPSLWIKGASDAILAVIEKLEVPKPRNFG
jgi:hypothetical protein